MRTRRYRRRKKQGLSLLLARLLQLLGALVKVGTLVLLVCGCLFLKDHLFAPQRGAGDGDRSQPDSSQATGSFKTASGAAASSDGTPGAGTTGGAGNETLAPDGTGTTGSVPTTPDSGDTNAGESQNPTTQTGPNGESTTDPNDLPAWSTEELYAFGTALGESAAVEDTFFDSALFLGDSRTEGLQLFSGLTHGTFLWDRGLHLSQTLNPESRPFTLNGSSVSLLEALQAIPCDAIYVMVGINDLGSGADVFEERLASLMDLLLEAKPNAVIYLQTLPPVNDAVARAHGLNSNNTTANVEAFNERVIRVAEEKRVVLLDTASLYRGPDGQLPEELTRDGVHFSYDGYTRWADYLRAHTLAPEVWRLSRAAEPQYE